MEAVEQFDCRDGFTDTPVRLSFTRDPKRGLSQRESFSQS